MVMMGPHSQPRAQLHPPKASRLPCPRHSPKSPMTVIVDQSFDHDDDDDKGKNQASVELQKLPFCSFPKSESQLHSPVFSPIKADRLGRRPVELPFRLFSNMNVWTLN
ncbi:unnamed protein product [Citrullus colocynthis]|uniref:Uncharacterized protein n=1 Tax=Citrullus colocynthis TaxID=252529 RepID=A0ABP0Y933_9ROSI